MELGRDDHLAEDFEMALARPRVIGRLQMIIPPKGAIGLSVADACVPSLTQVGIGSDPHGFVVFEDGRRRFCKFEISSAAALMSRMLL